MDDDLIEDDSSNPFPDRVNHPIKDMESVIATVSGYHGTERFKLIKLIAITGASYVGVLDRSITHLVCWQFKGKKYELARKLQTRVISHRWFEDCFKEGIRLPDGPYTMQSGKEVGPILWEVPHALGEIGKKSFFSREMNATDDHYQSLNSIKGKMIDPMYLSWIDSHLLKEDFFGGYDIHKKLSCTQVIRKPKRIAKKGNQSKRHQISILDDSHNWPESSSRSSLRSKRRRDSYHHACEVDAEPILKSNRPVKISEHMKCLNSSILECEQDATLADSVQLVPERSSFHSEESRKQLYRADKGKLSKYSSDLNFESSSMVTVLSIEDDPVIGNAATRGRPDLCESEERKESDAPISSHQHMELSCVICWTEFCTSRGVLPCGHRFCYSCIKEWADCMASRGKVSTCPLCKASFSGITRFEELPSSDQKIFSQTIPCGSSNVDDFNLTDNRSDTFGVSSLVSLCVECRHREPEDLLLNCHICRSQWVHSCCLDPPLLPWTCIHCRDLRMLYQRFR
ncbi:hypothetical protein HPP92_018029 [Vanilla planifolia]|uniref:RING-type E3 ubiquitin transferase BRCA1 n=1 Tax=Vanilla planifolia TaxID=51239 RepID=A0A835UKF4_VANPL|nr:hypothetical protein HPP92_018029 [Vanilla planifolia]